MEMIVAFTACVLLVALGDILSIASRAKIPAMAGIILLYLAATALGMPRDWPTLSGLAPLGDLMFPVFVAAVTTNILPRDVVRQWKFILIGCIAVGVSMLVTVLAGGALLGFSTAFSGAVVTCGGAFTGGMGETIPRWASARRTQSPHSPPPTGEKSVVSAPPKLRAAAQAL